MADLAYCVLADIQNRLSVLGVSQHIDDYPGVHTEVIDEASSVIDEYLYRHYQPSQLVGNRWIKHACSTIAAGLLFERRGNAPPRPLLRKINALIEKLEAIEEGRKQVPGLVRRRTSIPSLSSPRVTLGPFGPRVVIDRWRGSRPGEQPQDYVQPRDPLEPPGDRSPLGY